MDEQFKLMQEYMGDEIVKGMIIPIKLREHLIANPINPKKDFDLNPHLHIKHVCERVSQEVVKEGLECTYEEVMQLWLTLAVYHGECLPK